VLRIYPAYWVCLVFIGVFLSHFIGQGGDLSYVIQNFTLVFKLNNYIDGLFTTHYKSAANGVFWTLPWEVKCYGLVLVLGLLGQLKTDI